jgi:hypothetical protein
MSIRKLLRLKEKSVRKNFHKVANWADAIRAHVKKEREANRACFWDRAAYGVLICSGKDYVAVAKTDRAGRYLELKSDHEINEMLTWYEDQE